MMNLPERGVLGPLPREQKELRGDHRLLSCWARRSEPDKVAQALMRRLHELSRPPLSPAAIAEVDQAYLREETLALMLGQTPPQRVLDALLDAARAGVRVYALAGPGFGEGRRDPGLRELRHAHVLVRRLSSAPPCTAILSRRGERVALWLGYPQDAEPAWQLTLSKVQGAALFQLFVHLFWHEAVDEAWTGEGALSFRKAETRPFDAPAPGPRAPVRLLGLEQGRFAEVVGDTLHDPEAAPGNGIKGELRLCFTLARATGQEELASFARAGTRIVWGELALPAFRVDAGAGALELGTDSRRIGLVLEAAQALALHRLCAGAADVVPWQFHADAPLSTLQGELWLLGAPAPLPLIASEHLDAGKVEARELRSMAETPARSLPEPSPLALSVTYRWLVLPPRVPAGAKDDPMVTQWQEIDRRFERTTKELGERIDKLEEQAGGLQRFVLLAGALLGLRRSRSELREELDALGKAKPSALGPDNARVMLGRFAALKARLDEHEDDIRKEEARAEEEEERKAQMRAFEDKRRQAEEELAEARKERDAAEQKRKELKREQDELASQEPQENKEQKNRVGKLRYELEKLGKQINQVDAKIRAQEATLKERFEFKPSGRKDGSMPEGGAASGRGARFVPAPLALRSEEVPEEAPPRVGVLRKLKDTRYLVIDRWEEFSEGEGEAQRLGARLVAPEERA